jgi:PKD repeat protein
MVVTSHRAGTLCTAVIDNVSIAAAIGLEAPPLATIAIDPNPARPSDTVTFTASAIASYPGPDSNPLTVAWDFGDGASATGASVTHVYDAEGTYVVHVTVTDSNGVTQEENVEMVVSMTAAGATTPPVPATVRKLSATWDWSAPQRSSLRMELTLDLPEGFSPAGVPVSIDCGGAKTEVVLDRSGKAKLKKGSLKLYRSRNSTAAKLVLSRSQPDLADAMAALGLARDVKSAPVSIDVKATIGDVNYGGTFDGKYVCKSQRLARVN